MAWKAPLLALLDGRIYDHPPQQHALPIELMTNPDRHRAKMVRGLVRALDDEESHVRRYRRIGTACSFLGALVFILALFAAWGGSDGADVWLVVAGLVGGLLIGLALFFISSVEQWPVTREFLNVDAVREAARRYDLDES